MYTKFKRIAVRSVSVRCEFESLEDRRLFAAAPAVMPTVETDPVWHSGDAADDIAIWVHPTDPSMSTIIGTDKAEDDSDGGGIAVYELSGKEIQYRVEGDINNVDLRYNFMLDGEPTTIVAASNSDHNSIELYRVNERRKLANVANRRLKSGLSQVSGLAMYHSEESGKFYVFVNDRQGRHEQWELTDAGNGKVDGHVVRRFDAGRETEGLVADDELGWLYIAEEDYGIWKYGAEPGAGTHRTLVERVEMGDIDGPLLADVEGLALYRAADGEGYLIASSQGSDDYAIFDRAGDNEFVSKFRVGGNKELGVDRATNTDGIDVISFGLGPAFPNGLFIAQDGANGRQNQNFKVVSWTDVAATNPGGLLIDHSQDPRVSSVSQVSQQSGRKLAPAPNFMERFSLNSSDDDRDDDYYGENALASLMALASGQ
jgi:3-phytase